MVGYLARNAVAIGDVRELAGRLEPGSVQTIVTSPPYFGLRSYLDAEHEDKARELGGEKTPAEYVANLVAVFAALRNALKDDGTIWLNLGDSYAGQPGGPQGKTGDRAGRTFTGERDGGRRAAGYPQKCLLGIPWRVAFALINDGWILRSDCIWAKPNPMPESVADRPTQSHEYLFLLSKSPRYFYDADAIREPLARSWDATTNGGSMATMRHHDAHIGGTNRHTRAYPEPNPAGANKRSVWAVPSAPFPDAHYATFPPALIRPCVLAGTSEAGECSRCGKAWVRVVERGGLTGRRSAPGKPAHLTPQGYLRAGGSRCGDTEYSVTTGWAAQCRCGAPTRPQVVLDPFLGSGTTAQVAHEAGRDWIGIDLDERAVVWTRDRLARYPVGRLAGM